ncbi:unnamed protein product [Nezara viridula]|uniref:Uncharacterized protein n=1 Tax=Nezara viridula TaxID=85310 RepID=A0A9P0HRC5_NEZVI|nr:unnamed protein product [Nezara viridula]
MGGRRKGSTPYKDADSIQESNLTWICIADGGWGTTVISGPTSSSLFIDETHRCFQPLSIFRVREFWVFHGHKDIGRFIQTQESFGLVRLFVV